MSEMRSPDLDRFINEMKAEMGAIKKGLRPGVEWALWRADDLSRRCGMEVEVRFEEAKKKPLLGDADDV